MIFDGDRDCAICCLITVACHGACALVSAPVGPGVRIVSAMPEAAGFDSKAAIASSMTARFCLGLPSVDTVAVLVLPVAREGTLGADERRFFVTVFPAVDALVLALVTDGAARRRVVVVSTGAGTATGTGMVVGDAMRCAGGTAIAAGTCVLMGVVVTATLAGAVVYGCAMSVCDVYVTSGACVAVRFSCAN